MSSQVVRVGGLLTCCFSTAQYDYVRECKFYESRQRQQ